MIIHSYFGSKGDPGKGKTMLMIDLIKELSKQLQALLDRAYYLTSSSIRLPNLH